MLNVTHVPALVNAYVVVVPSKLIDVLATLLLSLASVTTNLSPFAIVISFVYNVPPFWIFPWVWEDGVIDVGKSLIYDFVIEILPKVAVTIPSVSEKAVNVFPAPGTPVKKIIDFSMNYMNII